MARIMKDSIAEYISGNYDLSKTEAKRLVGDIFAYIVDGVRDGDDVAIYGFGKFSRKARGARTGRNPRTGEAVEIPAHYAMTFKAAKQASETVDQ